MKKRLRRFLYCVIQILAVSLVTISLDYLIVTLTHDDSIWFGEAIEAVASIIWGPLVGGFATFISCLVTDYLTYHSFDYFFVGFFESSAIALIGVIYRHLNKDDDKFGIREIVVFNFVQTLINTAVIYLATPPAAILFFGSIVEDWTKDELVEDMTALGNDAFSACISVALIGTFLLYVSVVIRKKLRKHGKIRNVLHSVIKQTFITKEYRTRAFEYSVGFAFAIALSMVDGAISGHVLGTDALAATSLMFPLISFSTFISNAITSGCSNLCAISKGNGDYEKADKLFSLGLFTTIILGLMQTVLFYLFKELYFGYFTASKEIGAFAGEYYKYYIFVPPFMAAAIFLDEICSSDGDDMLSYAGYLSSFAVNVGMSLVLSKVMGMGGLSFATMLSYVSFLIVVSIHFLKKNNTYRLRLYFSFRDLFNFAERSLKTNATGLCMSAVSTAFTKAILLFWGSGYLIANTVLCAMLELYEIVNGPSEAAEYLFATYSGEKNSEGIRTLFKEVLVACLLGGTVLAMILLLRPDVVLLLYGIEDSSLRTDLIKCIRFASVGMIAAAVGGFLSDYYGNIGKPMWSCMMVVFRTALFPILFCVTFCLDGGAVGMGKGMLLSQIAAVAIFYGFVLIVKGSESIPYMLEDPDYEKVYMNSFEYTPKEYERIRRWIREYLIKQDIEDKNMEEAEKLFLSLCKKTEEKNVKSKVLGECVLRFIDEPEIIIKDNGVLFKSDIEDERLSYNILMSCNCNTIHLMAPMQQKILLQ